jgi:ATP-binding protein involved in chromosome partitioning
VPLDPGLVAAGDTGVPFVMSHPDAPAAVELLRIADALAVRERSLVGRPLGLQPA